MSMRPHVKVHNKTHPPDMRCPLPGPLSSATGRISEAIQSDNAMKLKRTFNDVRFIHSATAIRVSHITSELTDLLCSRSFRGIRFCATEQLLRKPHRKPHEETTEHAETQGVGK